MLGVEVWDIEVGEKEVIWGERVEEGGEVVRVWGESEEFEKERNVRVVCMEGSVYS